MAASFSVIIKCKICNSKLATITNTIEATKSKQRGKHYQCPRCGQLFPFEFASVALVHSAGLVGGETTITHTITKGSISSAGS